MMWKTSFQGGFVFTETQCLGIFYHLELRLKFLLIKIDKISQYNIFFFMLLQIHVSNLIW